MKEFNIDYRRPANVGFPEIVFGATKPLEVLVKILKEYQSRSMNALVTKVQPEKGEKLLGHFPGAFYEKVSGIFCLQLKEEPQESGGIGIIAAGTSDIFVVDEAYHTLRFLGIKAERIVDIGVSGIHRLMDRVEEINSFKILIVVAGFEAAIASVMGGLFPQPIIAVPTSVGYGVGAEGKAALSSMLASCANGLSVVNVDNGYGAAMAAFRMVQQFGILR